ncbi:acylphosphatase [Mangrovicella endophytica]|uniref:acylphosphatase n=1 Tax=Mangrovicella endophytica TaxID=2066697 RepID=UPI001FE21218|nr:acylphosphatase [Mangrovicella endophytica]
MSDTATTGEQCGEPSMNAMHVEVSGRVQGVGYRAWCAQAATRLNLSGWVRNRRDGRVEALIAGDEAAVNEMLALMRQGPAAARVERVEAAPATERPGGAFIVASTL